MTFILISLNIVTNLHSLVFKEKSYRQHCTTVGQSIKRS